MHPRVLLTRTLTLAAITASAAAGCGEILGIQDIHDDSPDAAIDGALPGDATGGDALERDADASGSGDAGDQDSGPPINAALGCTSPDGAAIEFFQGIYQVPRALGLGRRNVYVTDPKKTEGCSLEGCGAPAGVFVFSTAQVHSLAATDHGVAYCTFEGNVVFDAPDAGPLRSVDGGCDLMAAHGSDLYWSAGSQISHTTDGPAGAIDTVVVDDRTPTALAAASGWLFFVDVAGGDASAPRVARCDLPSCAGGIVAFDTPGVTAGTSTLLAVSNDRVFWSDAVKLKVLSCPLEGCGDGGLTALNVPFANFMSSLFADSKAIYFATSSTGNQGLGQVYKATLDGGSFRAISADNQTYAANIAANDSCIYWTRGPNNSSLTVGHVFAVVNQP